MWGMLWKFNQWVNVILKMERVQYLYHMVLHIALKDRFNGSLLICKTKRWKMVFYFFGANKHIHIVWCCKRTIIICFIDVLLIPLNWNFWFGSGPTHTNTHIVSTYAFECSCKLKRIWVTSVMICWRKPILSAP